MGKVKISWKAIYTDDSFIESHNKEGILLHNYFDIDRSRLQYFEVYVNNEMILRIHLDKGKRLIYRIRTMKNMFNPNDEKKIILAGWQETINGKNYQSIVYIFEDGHVELAGKWKDDRVFAEPKLLECEKGWSNE